MKLMIMPKNKEGIIKTLNNADSYLIGTAKLSVNMPYNFTLEELMECIALIKEAGKEVFIALNKNMHNSDIPYLKEVMLMLEGKVDGISFYDIAIVNIKKEHNLTVPLVWNQEHLTNNYITSNYWFSHGANYTMVSSEITLDEVKEIKEAANAKLILPIFGYLPMMVSKRHLVKNYLDTYNIEDNSNIYYLEYKGEEYPIIDNIDGSLIYSSRVLNGIKEAIDINMDYLLLDSFLIADEAFYEVVKMFKEVDINNVDFLESKIDSMFKTDRGFLDKETIYKVKKDA